MRFKLLRDRTIASTCGLAVEFKANQYTLVPPDMYAEVLQAGGVAEDEESMASAVDATAPPSPQSRTDAILKAFAAIVAKNDVRDFTAGNKPTSQAVYAITGWEPKAKERDELWNQFLQSRA